MRPLHVALAATAVVAGLPAVADAAPKQKPAPVCLQVTDPQADAKVGAVDAPSLDVVSGDIATGRNNLIVAMRMKTLTRDAFLPGGITYTWSWTVGGVKQQVVYYVYASGSAVAAFEPTANSAEQVSVKAVADAATSTITWTVPRKIVPTLKKAGAKLTGFTLSTRAATNWNTGVSSRGFVGNFGDEATSTKVYTDLAPTCLKGV